jgi:Domain of unknown function (DUF4276)
MLDKLALIVEGHGEVQAVPLLIRRIVSQLDATRNLYIDRPIRIPKSKLVREGELERAVELAARNLDGDGTILILLDSDCECPKLGAPRLLERATQSRTDMDIILVLAQCEFEAWGLASATSLRGWKGLPDDLEAPDSPEEIRGAKEWLERHMPRGASYSETVDQTALAQRIDLARARETNSFDKLFREIEARL